MNNNESKNPATEEQAANVQSVESTVENPVDIPDAGEAVARPGDDDTDDGEGFEAVTVVIVSQDPDTGGLAAESIKANLYGANADIHLVTGENLRETLAKTLIEHLPHVKTERIVLMTDGMVVLSPITLGDISCIKAMQGKQGLTYNTRTPLLLHKSVFADVLNAIEVSGDPLDPIDTYFKSILPDNFYPVMLKDWREDPWLLPVISKNPPIAEVRKWAAVRKFGHISSQSWSAEIKAFIEEMSVE